MLEVAAGTCALGRMVSPYVKSVTELDVTSAMLEVGKKEAQKENIKNLSFLVGEAKALPFDSKSFDVVMSRLAFHHFEYVDQAFYEMVRVLKDSGKLVVIDMEARQEKLRKRADAIETLRDPSHVKCRSREEFYALAAQCHMEITVCNMIPIPVSLNAWMDVTQVATPVRNEIIAAMKEDIMGGEQTGFQPYFKGQEIYFNHRWMLLIAKKCTNE